MAVPDNSSAPTPRPRLVGRFVASQALLWMLAAPILGAMVARLAVWVQNFRAPLVIFPLLVGCGLGLLLVGLMRLGQVGHRPTLWSGAIVAVAVAVAGQHYFSFLDWKAARMAERQKCLAGEMFQDLMPDAPTDFARFIERGRPVTAEFTLRGAAAWASWAADGLLVLLAVATILLLACRAPYCSICRSWYRTTRAGPLAADTARRVAEAAALPVDEPLGVDQLVGGTRLSSAHPTTTARYRLSHCASGCGPCRLELACGGQQETKVLETWLSAVQRGQVARVLDGG